MGNYLPETAVFTQGHEFGNDEVESSIPSRGTSKINGLAGFLNYIFLATPFN